MTAGESKESQGLQKRENWDSSILTAEEYENPMDHRREDWDQPNEDRKWNRKIPRRFPIKYNYFSYSSNGQKVLIFYSLFSYNVLYYCITDVIAGESKQY